MFKEATALVRVHCCCFKGAVSGPQGLEAAFAPGLNGLCGNSHFRETMGRPVFVSGQWLVAGRLSLWRMSCAACSQGSIPRGLHMPSLALLKVPAWQRDSCLPRVLEVLPCEGSRSEASPPFAEPSPCQWDLLFNQGRVITCSGSTQ